MPENNKLAPLKGASIISSESRERRPSASRSIEIGDIDAFGQFRNLWDLLVKHQWLILGVTVFKAVT